jgi:predicted membrane channel-forming protein YqfA (hemolysin III family)
LLAASPFIVNIAVWLLDTHDWKYMTFGSAIFQIMVASLIWLTFTPNRFHRKIPLYKVDWTSFVLLTIAILTGVYVLNYGEKLYWFQSTNIVFAPLLA